MCFFICDKKDHKYHKNCQIVNILVQVVPEGVIFEMKLIAHAYKAIL